MKHFNDIVSSFSFVIGWFIVVVSLCYLVASLLAGGLFIIIPSSALLVGVILIWISKKLK
ncbi:hypothetical protein [Halobacillus amylolyticus]|uniref:Uncharacterized protein n=1 Tax=Halobacillus amylolyticus TaxID=2932259 RepID=A0ABY4HEW9_9BACI|nr:hypothetical protein [Halobacillus amylolyticus]UOR12843.1 hypothetical protein MUO15_04850 [Halobacillus amylolyticus]